MLHPISHSGEGCTVARASTLEMNGHALIKTQLVHKSIATTRGDD